MSVSTADDPLTLRTLAWTSAAVLLTALGWAFGPETSATGVIGSGLLLALFATTALLVRWGRCDLARALLVVGVPAVCVPAVSRFWGIDGHLGLLLVPPVIVGGVVFGSRGVAGMTGLMLVYVGVEYACGPAPWSLIAERPPTRTERAVDLALLLGVVGVLVGLVVQQHRRALADALEREQIARATAERLALVEASQRDAMHAAESASQAKSVFLASMSHELRTPLNAILGYGEMLEEDLPDGQARADLGRILSSGQHLLALIDEVLDMSRVEAGTLEVVQEPVDVGELARAVRESVVPQAAARGVTVDPAGVDGGMSLEVCADRRRARQVLLNLLSNAVKFTRTSVGMAVRTTGDAVEIDVWDDGDGIPDALRSRLFEPFARGANSTAGTGLGLALSRELARRMGGDLLLVSSDTQGARFRFRLPRLRD